MSLLSLVYSSIATAPFDRAALQSLLHQARAYNQLCDITGLLLYRDAQFIQALEGPQTPLMALYARIQHDARHHGVTTLLIEALDERAYPVWAMGYLSVESHPLGGLTYSASPDLLTLPGAWSRTAAQRLLHHFQRRPAH